MKRRLQNENLKKINLVTHIIFYLRLYITKTVNKILIYILKYIQTIFKHDIEKIFILKKVYSFKN